MALAKPIGIAEGVALETGSAYPNAAFGTSLTFYLDPRKWRRHCTRVLILRADARLLGHVGVRLLAAAVVAIPPRVMACTVCGGYIICKMKERHAY